MFFLRNNLRYISIMLKLLDVLAPLLFVPSYGGEGGGAKLPLSARMSLVQKHIMKHEHMKS